MAEERLPDLEDKLRVVRKGILRRDVFLHRLVSFTRRNPGWVLAFLALGLIFAWLAFSVLSSLANYILF
jgi:hypothetical protein